MCFNKLCKSCGYLRSWRSFRLIKRFIEFQKAYQSCSGIASFETDNRPIVCWDLTSSCLKAGVRRRHPKPYDGFINDGYGIMDKFFLRSECLQSCWKQGFIIRSNLNLDSAFSTFFDGGTELIDGFFIAGHWHRNIYPHSSTGFFKIF